MEPSREFEPEKFGATLGCVDRDLGMDVFFPLNQDGMTLILASEDNILFLINRGALGEHL